ncbi:MAG: RNA polymerase sigma-70 factor [Cyclobacteriaceae bacterium]|nr:RNA polymerase sigma-70 factor [Cyclobacteriaceae bacterium]
MDFNPNKTLSDDKKVILALKKGERWAFRSVFDQYHLKLYHFAVKMGLSHEDAEGIVQEVFITIWEKRSNIKEELHFKSFLYTITKRLTIKKIRRLILENDFQTTSKNNLQNFNHETEEYIVFSDLMEQANTSIEKLPVERKQIFMLSKQHGLSNQEIAEKLNISIRTVENQLYRATKTLRDDINYNILP